MGRRTIAIRTISTVDQKVNWYSPVIMEKMKHHPSGRKALGVSKLSSKEEHQNNDPKDPAPEYSNPAL